MNSIMGFVHFIETFPITGSAICLLITTGVIGIVTVIYKNLIKRKEDPYVKSYYWGLSKNFYITTVLEYFPDNSPSGYRQVQYSRPDLWSKKVSKITKFKLFHKIIPSDDKAILVVLVKKQSQQKHVLFNREI